MVSPSPPGHVAGDGNGGSGGSLAARDSEDSLRHHLRSERLAEPLHELLLGDASLRRVHLRRLVSDLCAGDHLLRDQRHEPDAQLALIRDALEVQGQEFLRPLGASVATSERRAPSAAPLERITTVLPARSGRRINSCPKRKVDFTSLFQLTEKLSQVSSGADP